ncbi:uncharacterized protein LOC120353702 [Nilaparvata lugens]|uniref:uncharacterized protein LOC120353702 n=1 Tax=Nilaparvata lugens TaxID=108931 RepID=UPI00193D76BD|nr:uncharacterized protein LOC120353702 [Nilaparvata lugens]
MSEEEGESSIFLSRADLIRNLVHQNTNRGVLTEPDIIDRPIMVDSQLEVLNEEVFLLDGERYKIMDNVEIQVTNYNQDLVTDLNDLENDGVESAMDKSQFISNVPVQEAKETNCDQTFKPCTENNVNDDFVESNVNESRLMQDVEDVDVEEVPSEETTFDHTFKPCTENNVNDDFVESNVDESRLMQDVEDVDIEEVPSEDNADDPTFEPDKETPSCQKKKGKKKTSRWHKRSPDE